MEELLIRLRGLDLGAAPYCFWLFCGALMFLHPLEKRGRWPLRAAGCALAFTLAGWLLPSNLLGDRSPLLMLWYVAAWLLICAQCGFICRLSVREALFCGTNALLAEHIGSSAQILLTVKLFRGDMAWLNLCGLLVYPLVYALLWLSIGRRMPRGRSLKLTWPNVATVSAAGLIVTVALSMLVKSNLDPNWELMLAEPHAVALADTAQLYAIFFCVTMLALQCVQQRELRVSAELAAVHELWSVRQKQFEMSRDTIEAINRKCHDMKHQVAALMAQGGGSAERARYAAEVEELIRIYDLRVNTNNEALNTLLMEKGLYCGERGISWNCAVDGESLDFMDRMDLYVLLGNALDNAIEAVERIPDSSERIIQLRIGRKDAFVHIRLENSFTGELHWRDGLPATTKADAESHGYGLGSIRAIARKYGGEISVRAEDGAFLLDVLIPIPARERG